MQVETAAAGPASRFVNHPGVRAYSETHQPPLSVLMCNPRVSADAFFGIDPARLSSPRPRPSATTTSLSTLNISPPVAASEPSSTRTVRARSSERLRGCSSSDNLRPSHIEDLMSGDVDADAVADADETNEWLERVEQADEAQRAGVSKRKLSQRMSSGARKAKGLKVKFAKRSKDFGRKMSKLLRQDSGYERLASEAADDDAPLLNQGRASVISTASAPPALIPEAIPDEPTAPQRAVTVPTTAAEIEAIESINSEEPSEDNRAGANANPSAVQGFYNAFQDAFEEQYYSGRLNERSATAGQEQAIESPAGGEGKDLGLVRCAKRRPWSLPSRRR